MERGPHTTSQVLEYARPQKRERLFKPMFVRWAMGYLFVLVICIGVAIAGYPEVFIAYVVFGFIVMFGAQVVFAFQAKRKSRATEEEDNAEWESRRRGHEEMLGVAQQIYANGPLGVWEIMYGFRHNLGRATVQEKRVIEFQTDGKGVFRAFGEGELADLVGVAFEYKSGGADRLLVRLVESTLEGWNEVAYGFDLCTKYGDPKLVLWLDSENPMPEGSRELWPFRGEYLREGDLEGGRAWEYSNFG